MADATTTTATHPLPAAPHAKEVETKGVAKDHADAAVATDPHAVHAVHLTLRSPKVWASAATGAVIGSVVPGAGTVAGAVIGGTAGLIIEKYQMFGGPIGRAHDWIKSKLAKKA